MTEAETEKEVYRNASPEKMSDKTRRMHHYQKVCEIMRPYHGRIVSEWTDKRHNSIYVWLVCSKEADCGGDPEKGEPHDRHQWRGTVVVQIMHDGSTYFAFSEDMVANVLGDQIDKSWNGTIKMMERMIPDLTT